MPRAVDLPWGPVLVAGLLGLAYLVMGPASGAACSG
jgi:hypothetical protein